MMQPPAGRPRPPASIIVAVVLILILGVVTVYSGFTVMQLPEPMTETAARVDTLYQPVLWISLIVFFLVTSGIIWAIFRYQRKDNSIPVQVHGSSSLEAAWTIIPVLILVVLFVLALPLLLDIKEPPSDADTDVTVEAVGHQWWWEFVYPDSGIKVQSTPPNYEDLDPPAMVVPVGAVVKVIIKSTDVIHSFGVPRTLYKMHAIPGNVNIMHFKADEEGVFYGQCYQFCGLRHSDMLFVLDVRSQSEYDTWVRETRAQQGITSPLDQASTTSGSGTRNE